MADLYGTPGGEVAWTEMRGREVATQESLGRIAAQPAALRKTEVETEKLEQELNSERQMAALMQQAMMGQGGPGEGSSSVLPFDSLARAAAGAGLIGKAQELAKTAALLRQRDAAAASSSASRAKNMLEAQREQINLFGQTFGAATDESSWARASDLYTFSTGQESPFSGVPYSEELVQQLNQNAQTTKERIDAEEKRLSSLELNAYRNVRLDQIDTQNDIREANLRLAREREARLKKAGGKGTASPATAEVDQARRLIAKDYPGLGDGLGEAAYDIAAEARSLRRDNSSLSAAQALQQAYNSAVQAGDIQKSPGDLLNLYSDKVRYSGAGKTPQTAARLPSDTAKLQPNRFYMNDAGMVAKWDGKAFVVVEVGRAPLSGNNGDLDPDLEEDEE